MSEFEENAVEAVEATETSPVKKPFIKKKATIAAAVAGVLVIAGVVGVNAFRNKPEVRLATAFSNLFNDKDISVGVSMQMTPEFLAASGMTDTQVQDMGRPGITTVEDAAKALGLVELRISNYDLSATDDKLSSELQLMYGDKSVIDLSLINRVLYLSTDAMTLPDQSPQLVTQAEIDGVMSALQMYASFAPQLSGAIDAMTTGKAVALRFEKGTPLGDAFDQYTQESQKSALNSKTIDAFKDANTTAIRNSATIKVVDNSDDESQLLAIDLSIDMYKYMKEMEKPLTELAKDQLEVLGTDISGTSKNYLKEIKSLKGKTLNIRTWIDDSNEFSRIDIDLSGLAADLNADKWDVVVRIHFTPSDIQVPADYYDLTEDLLSLGLI